MKKFISILMAALLVVAMAIPTFAAPADDLGIPSPNLVIADSPGYTFALITHTVADNQYYLHLFKSTPLAIRQDDPYCKLSASDGYKSYRLLDGLWSFQSESDSNLSMNIDWQVNNAGIAGRSYVWSSSPIGDYYSPNPNFFPKPLYFLTQEVTAETLQQQTVPAVVGTITTLTLCGVGLIALLVVLNLFGKRSLISRG